MIKGHTIFSNQQKSVELQLSVTLFLLGRKFTIWDIASKFGISIGSVVKYTQRVIIAIQSLRSQYLLMELTLTYMKHLANHVQGVIDHLGQFINYDIGWPASVYDAKVFSNSSLYIQQHILFQSEDYVLTDSTYPISKNCISSFKVLTGQQRLFNKKYNKTRVVMEQDSDLDHLGQTDQPDSH
ncbi:5744_t:CDS:2 [Funneliformis geosporum]|nr:5744_t:CDS:2 [Funneliformis geosporum]